MKESLPTHIPIVGGGVPGAPGLPGSVVYRVDVPFFTAIGAFILMKKTTFGAVLAFLFAAAGALTAAALYLYHREKELDEYERLLFSDDYDDFDDEDDTDATTYETIHDAAKTEE